MSRRRDPKLFPRLGDEWKEESFYDESLPSEDQMGETRTLFPQPVAESFHTTISQDRTDQDALDRQPPSVSSPTAEAPDDRITKPGVLGEVGQYSEGDIITHRRSIVHDSLRPPSSVGTRITRFPSHDAPIDYTTLSGIEARCERPPFIVESHGSVDALSDWRNPSQLGWPPEEPNPSKHKPGGETLLEHRRSGARKNRRSGKDSTAPPLGWPQEEPNPSKHELGGETLLEHRCGELETLRKENLALEDRLQSRGVRWQAIYRVHRHVLEESSHADKSAQSTTYYLDEPHWVKGDRGVASLQGNLLVRSVESYRERNPEISFFVFRSFKLHEAKREEEDQEMVAWSESIYLTSPDLIKAVKNANCHILKSSEGHTRTDIMNTETELPAPYLPFFHYGRTLEYCNTDISQGPRRGWQLLWQYVFENYGDEYMQVHRWLESGTISRAYIKYLIKHNDILLSKASRHLYGYRAVSQPCLDSDGSVESQQAGKKPSEDEYNSQTWKVWTEAWKFDGNFQKEEQEISFIVPSGRDEILSIRDLELVPVQYAEPQFVVRLRDRGLQFWKSRSRRYISYRTQRDTDNSRDTDLRYMIDPITYKKLHKNYALPLRDDLGPELLSAEEPPPDPFPLLLPATINGFNMQNKKWEELDADRICDVRWNTDAFDNLVIDDTTKNLIQALVMRQLEAGKGMDLIAGKGQGLIILLHGGPGTGKTFTAESVAEIAKKPLYRVICGDLGTEPTKVEEYLESVLYLGKIWDCVVLLDEADVYLEQRSMESLSRNALVSVFLRVIEYYEGILILTSNRVGTFDEAFKSRLQLALHYERLKLKDRRKIWENFIKRLETLEETGIDFDDISRHVNALAKHELNGRQIRNAITTARQLARYEKKDLGFDNLEKVIKIALKFDKYTTEMQDGRTDDEVMRSDGVRA